jgi:hypothetical protein
MKQIPPEIESRLVYKTRKNADDDVAAYPTLEKLKPVELACDGCNQVVVDRTTELKIYTFPIKHWREYCNNCQMFKNPETGVFDIKKQIAPSYFKVYIYNKNK